MIHEKYIEKHEIHKIFFTHAKKKSSFKVLFFKLINKIIFLDFYFKRQTKKFVSNTKFNFFLINL